MEKKWIALGTIVTALPPTELGIRAPAGWPDPLAAEVALIDLRVVVLETSSKSYELVGPIRAYAELHRALGGSPTGRLQAIVCSDREEADETLMRLRVVRRRAADPDEAVALATSGIRNPAWKSDDRAMLVGMPPSTWFRLKNAQAPEPGEGTIKLAGLGKSLEGEE